VRILVSILIHPLLLDVTGSADPSSRQEFPSWEYPHHRTSSAPDRSPLGEDFEEAEVEWEEEWDSEEAEVESLFSSLWVESRCIDE